MFIAIGSPLFVVVAYVIYLIYNSENKQTLEEILTIIAGGIIILLLLLGIGALILHGVKTIDNNNKEIEKIKYDISQIESRYGTPKEKGGWDDLSTMKSKR